MPRKLHLQQTDAHYDLIGYNLFIVCGMVLER